MKKISLVLITIMLIGLVSAQLGIFGGKNNSKVVNLDSVTITTTTGGDNVTSVASSTNCITVNPTTGDVILTFNSSCGGSSAVDSVTSGDNYLIVNPTTGNVVIRQNTTTLNGTILSVASVYNNTILILTINTTQNIMALGFYNNTKVDELIANAGNASWNQSFANTLYYSILNPSNFINITSGQFFNDTNLIYSSFQSNFNLNLTGVLPLENRTISHISNITGFLYNYNQTIPTNPFNQVLNTTSNVTFDYITSTRNITSNKWINGLFNWTTTTHFLFDGATLSATNLITQWLYNQTTPVFTGTLLNSTIDNRGVAVGFNSTYNVTYDKFAYNQTIPTNPFNQVLNTTSNVTFDYLNTTGRFSQKVANDFETYSDYFVGTKLIARIISSLESYYLSSKNNEDLVFSNDDFSNILSIRDNQTLVVLTTIGFEVANPSGTSYFVVNKTNGIRANLDINATGEIYLNNGTKVSLWLYNQTIKSNVFNQELNTTSNVTFSNVTVSRNSFFGQNITAQMFLGRFNWISSNLWNHFNGTTLTFNETQLNRTIDNRGVAVGFNSTYNVTYDRFAYNQTFNNNTGSVNRSNCWKDDCSGFRDTSNQATNTTSQVTFNKITTNQFALGTWNTFNIAGTPYGEITSALGLFEFHALNSIDFYFTNTARDTIINLANAGRISFTAPSGVDYAGVFQFNATRNTFTTPLHVNNYINATKDICITGGKCLNNTITQNNPVVNNSIIYWNNNTLQWATLNGVDGSQLVICSNKIQWLGIGALCPI